MSGLFGGGVPKATVPAPPPQVDDATMKINAEDAAARRQGRKTTILTSEQGLPNLGSTSRTGQ
ncbi:MAG: hypothetical protein IPM11_01180 [Micropruina sp.]|nr:hypothetical protein [Micropruina sp.]